MNSDKVVIIGGGQAAAQATITLRQSGFKGHITLISSEGELPYQRPPLSKAFLKGELAKERLYFRPDKFYNENDVELFGGMTATAVDTQVKTVTLDNGQSITYDKLLIATGAPPRQLPDTEKLTNVHYLRTIRDAEKLSPVLNKDGRLVVIGAGYIGLEVAAVAKRSGLDVTIVEMADRVLARVASPPVSEFFQTLHGNEGVDIRLETSVKKLNIEGDKVVSVSLSDEQELSCEAVLVGIGAIPATDIAQKAGLEVENGILVDAQCRTSDKNIWAAGDCTNFPSHRYGRRMRLESVPNAIEQAKVAAKSMLGEEALYEDLPWFWSDQYEVKLQTVGIMQGYDILTIRGEPTKKAFSVWYFKKGELLAVDALNDPVAFMTAKKMLATGKSNITPEQAGDISFELKSAL